MLHSKYLTEEGMEIMLRTLYKNGWRYINKIGETDTFYASIEKPLYCEDASCFICHGPKYFLSSSLNIFIADALKGLNCVEIEDHIDVVDWSTVKVDTPVKVFYDNGDFAYRSHFADYVDGQVYVFPDGTTSWSATQEPVPVKNVKLNED